MFWPKLRRRLTNNNNSSEYPFTLVVLLNLSARSKFMTVAGSELDVRWHLRRKRAQVEDNRDLDSKNDGER